MLRRCSDPFISLILEFPLAGVDWPGGILADEMGLGKTVEVLALILCHTRQGLKQSTLTLPVVSGLQYRLEYSDVGRRSGTVSQQCLTGPESLV